MQQPVQTAAQPASPSRPPLEEVQAGVSEFRIGLESNRVTVNANLLDKKTAQELIKRLHALEAFLPDAAASGLN